MTALYDVAAEQRLLGGLLLDSHGTWLGQVLRRVDRDTFYRGPHGDALDALVDVWSADEPIDLPSVAARLRERGCHDLVGELSEWTQAAGHPGSTVHDADRVAHLAERRRAAQALWDAYTAACDESQDLSGAVDRARQALDAPSGSEPLSIVWRDEFDSLGDVSWLVDQRIAHGLSVILGRSGSLKSFLATDIACSIASGHQWFGHRVDGPAKVLYVLAEGVESVRPRVEAWEQDRDGFAGYLGIFPHALQLDEPKDQQRLIAACRSIQPKFIVVDTMRRNMAGDENDAERVNALVYALGRASEVCGASAMVVHHTGATMDNAHRGRGSQVLHESADTVIGVQRDADYPERITLYNSQTGAVQGKQRNAKEWPPLDLYAVEVADSLVLSTSPVGKAAHGPPPTVSEPTTRVRIATDHAGGDLATVARWIEQGHLVRYRDGGPQGLYVSADVAAELPA